MLVNRYGFEYPPFAVDGPVVPVSAPYTGGMTRVDVRAAGDCSRAWTSTVRTASLSKLTTGDGLIHALTYGPRRTHTLGSAALPLDQGLPQKVGPA